jgi:thioredoxin reductase
MYHSALPPLLSIDEPTEILPPLSRRFGFFVGTVDLVVTGDDRAALAAAVDAMQRGRCVLVVLRSGDARAVQRVRRRLCRAANSDDSRFTVMTNAEVVCVDGVDGVEAVVIRHSRTGYLYAVNASAFLSCDGSTWPAHAGRGV